MLRRALVLAIVLAAFAAAPVRAALDVAGFLDPGGTVTIAQVLGRAHPAFQPLDALPVFPEGNTPRVYWLRERFNPGRDGDGWALAYIYKITRLDLYSADGTRHVAAGFDLGARDGALVPGVLALPGWALRGEPVYVRIATVIDPRSVRLVPLADAVRSSLQRRITFGLFVGFFIAIGAFNLLLYVKLRDRPLLTYAGIMLLQTATIVTSFGVFWMLLPPLSFLGRELIYDTLAIAELTALAAFSISFLRLRETGRSAMPVVIVGTLAVYSIYITDFFPSTTVAFDWTFVVSLAYYSALIYAGVRAFRSGMRVARLYAIGIGCTMAGYIVNMNSYLLPRQDLWVYAVDAGVMLQALLIAIAIAQNVQETRAEHERLVDTSRRLEVLATRDGLTGVFNRRAFDEALRSASARAAAERRRLGILILDIDHFKAYNDILGHQAGDEALKAIARACDACMRESDVFARYGGEEFAAIVPDATDAELHAIAHRMCASLSEMALPRGDGGVLTISVGCASDAPATAQAGIALLAAADAALYAAKRDGRNRVNLAAAPM